ncbi:hypothetical protein TRFO_05750 [Tritrichomonas foetus]|uniref:Uncharacterized protein n=1 Tax=Tritrichomonas foetus TaxID=1144522 RepID=A0A1J4K891_9EUKA|nr:hypothetical protein TRFO_05750 [Tritrichomonas foetus]|eukprot:OHT05653.1 hypothetical protein TRFO_05750 [Tritrichomonas foetus]
MQRWASYSTYDPIETLLEREDVTIVDVLDEDSLSIAMRNSSQKLVDFFKREEIMDELLNWALTELYVDHPKFMKFSRASISIFTCVTVNFQKMLHENDQFLIRLRQFQMLNPASPRICGHFQRIIETLVIGTGGDILVFFPELSDFLIENIANVGLRDLFVFLVTKYRIQFHADVEMFQKLINQIGFETNNDNIDNYNSCYCIISAIRAILSQKEEYFILFDTKEIFDRLFLLAVYPKTHPLLATGIYRLFPYLKRAKNYYPAMLKYRDMYEFRDDISLPYAIETFMLIDGKILLKIFDKNSCTYLIDAICKAFMNKGYYFLIDHRNILSLKN